MPVGSPAPMALWRGRNESYDLRAVNDRTGQQTDLVQPGAANVTMYPSTMAASATTRACQDLASALAEQYRLNPTMRGHTSAP